MALMTRSCNQSETTQRFWFQSFTTVHFPFLQSVHSLFVSRRPKPRWVSRKQEKTASNPYFKTRAVKSIFLPRSQRSDFALLKALSYLRSQSAFLKRFDHYNHSILASNQIIESVWWERTMFSFLVGCLEFSVQSLWAIDHGFRRKSKRGKHSYCYQTTK